MKEVKFKEGKGWEGKGGEGKGEGAGDGKGGAQKREWMHGGIRMRW